jgi:hypothetical protein
LARPGVSLLGDLALEIGRLGDEQPELLACDLRVLWTRETKLQSTIEAAVA